MDQDKIGKFIASLRKEKHITQQELADYLGVSDKAVSKWERGLNYPDISLLTSISEYFGVSINELLSGEKKMPDTDTVKKNKDKQEKPKKAATIKNRHSKKIIAAISAILIFIAIISIYKEYKLRQEQIFIQEFNNNLEDSLLQLNFKRDNPLTSPNWVLKINDITYIVPNSGYKAKSKISVYKEILSYDDYENFTGMVVYCNNTNCFSIYNISRTRPNVQTLHIECDEYGTLITKDNNYSEEEMEFYNSNKNKIKNRISEISMMWYSVYNSVPSS